MERWPYFRYFRPILCTVENDSGLSKGDLTSEVTLNRGHTLLDFNIFHSCLFDLGTYLTDVPKTNTKTRSFNNSLRKSTGNIADFTSTTNISGYASKIVIS